MGRIKKDLNPDAEVIKLNHGVSNKHYTKRLIIENLSDDINTIRKVFEIFNEELFEGQLDTPYINIIPSLKVKYNYKVEMPTGWKKSKWDREEDCIRMFLSEKIYLKNTKDIYVTLVEAMIMQYDLEMAAMHKGAGSKWKRLINNNNNYFGKRYRVECEKRGLKIIESEKEDKIDKEEKEKENKKPVVCAGKIFDDVYLNYNIENNFKLVYKYVPPKIEQGRDKGNNGQSMRLFICPECKMKIRVTKTGDIDIRCYNDGCEGTRFELDKSKK